MPVKTLTARFVDSVKPTDKRIEYGDTEVPGLVLRVTPTGVKTWVVRYYNRQGTQQRLTLGSLAALTLAQARARAKDDLHAASKGEDPAVVKQEAKTATTVTDLAALYVSDYLIGPKGQDEPRRKSWKAQDNLLRNKVLPKWRHRPIADIHHRDCIALVKDIAKRAPIVANRVVSLLSRMFGFAVDHDLLDVSPAIRIPKPGEEKTRDRVLTEEELRTAWHCFDTITNPVMAAFWKLRLVTGQRGGEVDKMKWTDLDLDGRNGAWWNIPQLQAKNRLPHRVPLNATAVAIIASLRNTNPDRAPSKRLVYVLAGARGDRQQSEVAQTFTVPDFEGHDLRRTFSTTLTSCGIDPRTVGKLLNHKERSVLARHYDRYGYDKEKRATMTFWDAKLKAILADAAEQPEPTATVLPFTVTA